MMGFRVLHGFGSAIKVENAKEGKETSYTTNPKYKAMNQENNIIVEDDTNDNRFFLYNFVIQTLY